MHLQSSGRQVRFVILGAGALGSLVGGFLGLAGADVILVGRTNHVDAIRRGGLTITGLRGKHNVKLRAMSEPSAIIDADVLFLTTKTRDTIAALDSVSHLFGAVKCVASLQNGMAKGEQLRQRFGADKVIGAVTMLGGSLGAYGEVNYTSEGMTFFGEPDGRRTDRVENMGGVFESAGFRVQLVDDIHSVEWIKLLFAIPSMALCSLTRLKTYQVMKDPTLARLYVQIVRECLEVAINDGARISDYPSLEIVNAIDKADFDQAMELVMQKGLEWEHVGRTGLVSSMFQSIVDGKKTELEETLGYVVTKGRQQGVNIPAMEIFYNVIRGIDAHLA